MSKNISNDKSKLDLKNKFNFLDILLKTDDMLEAIENNQTLKNDLRNYFAHRTEPITKFDLKSSIKLSYGTKEKLDEINKKSPYQLSYEEIILKLLKENQNLKEQFHYFEEHSNNFFDFKLNNFKRKKKNFELFDMKIRYSYNEFIDTENFEYFLKFEKAVRKGKEIPLSKFYQVISILYCDREINNLKESEIIGELSTYFMILFQLIKSDFNLKESIINKKLTEISYVDYNFNKFRIPSRIRDKDIVDKLDSFKLKLKQLHNYF